MAYARIRPKRGTASQWSTANTVLAEGELGIEVPDSGVGKGKSKVKIGDGTTAWNSLPYAVNPLDYIANSNTVTEEGYALDARMGKTLSDKIDSALPWKWCVDYTNGTNANAYNYPLTGYGETNIIVRSGNALYQAILPIDYIRGNVFTIGGVYFNGNGLLQGEFTRLTIYTR